LNTEIAFASVDTKYWYAWYLKHGESLVTEKHNRLVHNFAWLHAGELVCFWGLLLILVCSSFGCSNEKELLTGLSEKQSVEALVVLGKEQISAERYTTGSGRGGSYRISVSPRDFDRALAVVHEYGLPRTDGPQLEEFLRPQSFAPSSPGISQLRLDYALGLQIERTLVALPGVVDAKVMVRSNLDAGSSTADKKSAATVVLRYDSPSNNLPFSAKDVRQIVADAVPDINPESVQLQLSKVYTLSENSFFSSSPEGGVAVVPLTKIHGLFNFRVADEDRRKALLQMVIYLFAFCFCGIAIGYVWGGQATKHRLARRARRTGGAQAPSKSFFIEASFAGQEARSEGVTGRYLTEQRKK
jgi:type III secretion system YscJ/HrcJ family lipoprotein